jgi:hypothetical protein
MLEARLEPEQAEAWMDAREAMLAEFETEMARTRPFLELVPMDQPDF